MYSPGPLVLALLMSIGCLAQSIRPGDRIAIVGNTFADQLRMHGYFETLLMLQTAENPVSVRNLGWAGDMLKVRDRPTNFPAEAKTLGAHKTDVIIACFGMGESFAGEAGIVDFRKGIDAFLASHRGQQYNGESDVRIILVSPIAYENLGEITPNLDARNADLAAYTQAMAVVAAERKIAFVDLNAPTAEWMAAEGPNLTTNGITLRGYGYWAAARVLAQSGPADTATWQLRVDAKEKTGGGTGGTISGISAAGGGIAFTVKEDSWPSQPPPGGQAHATLANDRDTLTVAGLGPGDYRLEVDGTAVTSASHSDWAKGVIIEASPAHAALEAFREAINDKNRQFTYSWKALNQVHIVGQRRSSASGRALPAEVIEFNKLADQKDAELRAGIPLKTRNWQLVPVTQ
jgi:hypothetical protein